MAELDPYSIGKAEYISPDFKLFDRKNAKFLKKGSGIREWLFEHSLKEERDLKKGRYNLYGENVKISVYFSKKINSFKENSYNEIIKIYWQPEINEPSFLVRKLKEYGFEELVNS